MEYLAVTCQVRFSLSLSLSLWPHTSFSLWPQTSLSLSLSGLRHTPLSLSSLTYTRAHETGPDETLGVVINSNQS